MQKTAKKSSAPIELLSEDEYLPRATTEQRHDRRYAVEKLSLFDALFLVGIPPPFHTGLYRTWVAFLHVQIADLFDFFIIIFLASPENVSYHQSFSILYTKAEEAKINLETGLAPSRQISSITHLRRTSSVAVSVLVGFRRRPSSVHFLTESRLLR